MTWTYCNLFPGIIIIIILIIILLDHNIFISHYCTYSDFTGWLASAAAGCERLWVAQSGQLKSCYYPHNKRHDVCVLVDGEILIKARDEGEPHRGKQSTG